jgi:hypothetical protein
MGRLIVLHGCAVERGQRIERRRARNPLAPERQRDEASDFLIESSAGEKSPARERHDGLVLEVAIGEHDLVHGKRFDELLELGLRMDGAFTIEVSSSPSHGVLLA